MKINGQNYSQVPENYDTHRLTLAFSSLTEEQEFKKEHSLKSTLYFRFSLIGTILVYVIYAFLRSAHIPVLSQRSIIGQDVVFAVIVLLLLALSFIKNSNRWLQGAAALTFITAGFVISTTRYMWPVADNFFTVAMVLVIFYGYTFLRLRFLFATLSGWTILLIYLVSFWLTPNVVVAEIITPLLTLAFSNIVGMIIAYSFEYNFRRQFILQKLLNTPQMPTDKPTDKPLPQAKEALDVMPPKKEADVSKPPAPVEPNQINVTVQLQISELLNRCANRFLQSSAEEIDEAINHALQTIAEYARVDRGYIYLFYKQDSSLFNSHIWCAKGIEQKIKNHEGINNADFAWLVDRIRKKELIMVNNVNQMPLQASSIQTIFSVEGVQSFMLRSLFFNGKVLGFVGLDSVKMEKQWTKEHIYLLEKAAEILVNVLDRKKSIWATKKSEDKLSALIERTDDVVFITTPEGKILDINPAGVKLFGFPSLSSLLQATVDETFYENPEDRRIFQKIMEEKGYVKGYELVLKRRDGKRVIVLETAKAVRDDHGKIVAYEGIMRDVTEQRQLERQFFQSQKMESIGLLAGGIAHDFNNIVTAINGYADMILMSLPKTHPHYKNVLNILKGGKRAEKLTRQLLAFSRKQIIKPKVVDINAIITELAKMLRRLIGEDIVFETKLKSKIGNIQADPSQIQQILVNLVINARDAIIDLRDKNAQKKIVVITDEVELDENFVRTHPGSRVGKHVVISVSDTGVGIDDDIKSKVFEPFFTTKEEGRGTGLGLSTVYGIVKQNNASIYTEGMPGEGTVFTIYWPLSTEDKSTTTTDDTSAISMKKKSTVLVVEDDENVRELACSFLTSLGYNILQAEDGLKALEVLNKNNTIHKIDLLLTDIVMPGMRGDELAERVKKLRPNIKIILTSGYTDSDIIQSGLMNDQFAFLPKPYTIKQMAKKIENILEG
jgi:two-component system, cell cycle sensor histidine kinase and response regulator CckA